MSNRDTESLASRATTQPPEAPVKREPTIRFDDLECALLDHIRERVAAGDRYFKSRKIANRREAPGDGVDEIGRVLTTLEGDPVHSLQFERFSETGCITWHITESDD